MNKELIKDIEKLRKILFTDLLNFVTKNEDIQEYLPYIIICSMSLFLEDISESLSKNNLPNKKQIQLKIIDRICSLSKNIIME